jgi:hypothetical protein
MAPRVSPRDDIGGAVRWSSRAEQGRQEKMTIIRLTSSPFYAFSPVSQAGPGSRSDVDLWR